MEAGLRYFATHASHGVRLAAGCLLLTLASCVDVSPTIFVNGSAAEVKIRYVMTREMIAPGQPAHCSFELSPPRVATSVVSGRDYIKAEWAYVDNAQFDERICAVDYAVKPGTSIWIELNGFCSDYGKYLKVNPALHPSLESFAFTSPSRSIELRGWDVARAFKRRSGGACIYAVGT